MGDKTGIEWTDATWNPLRGCSRVSEGCRNCYAETVAGRFCGPGQPYEGLIARGGQWNGRIRLVPEALQIPWRWTKPRRIFVNSMSDLFHPEVPFDYIAAVFFIMSVTSRHTYQILTKRPERMLEFFRWLNDCCDEDCGDDAGDVLYDAAHRIDAVRELPWKPLTARRGGYDDCGPLWPLPNVWLGVSVENQQAAEVRIPLLLQVPAAVRWISAEPLLGPISFEGMFANPADPRDGTNALEDLDWVVVGGESGADARPMHPDWVRGLRDECVAVGTPFLFKQWGEWAPGEIVGMHKRSLMAATWFGGRWDFQMASPPRVDDHADDEPDLFRIGKRAAGRHLDGVLHDEYPQGAA